MQRDNRVLPLRRSGRKHIHRTVLIQTCLDNTEKISFCTNQSSMLPEKRLAHGDLWSTKKKARTCPSIFAVRTYWSLSSSHSAEKFGKVLFISFIRKPLTIIIHGSRGIFSFNLNRWSKNLKLIHLLLRGPDTVCFPSVVGLASRGTESKVRGMH